MLAHTHLPGTALMAVTDGLVEPRSNRLVRGLHRRGARSPGLLAIYTADFTSVDTQAAITAGRKLDCGLLCQRLPNGDEGPSCRRRPSPAPNLPRALRAAGSGGAA